MNSLRVVLSLVAVLLLTSQAFATAEPPVSFSLISDVDDTVKITHVSNPLSAAFNGLAKKKAFSGMGDLYDILSHQTAGQEVHYISGSPLQLQKKIHSFLEQNGFPAGNLILRDWVHERDQSAYKTVKLEAIAAQTENSPSPQKFILLGDDTEHDPEIYAEFAAKHPDRVMAIYIHKIKARPLPQGQYGFFTAFDIAVSEFLQDRISLEDLSEIASVIRHTKSNELIIPDFAACPFQSGLLTSDQLGGETPDLEKLILAVNERVEKICAKRVSKS